MTAPDVEEVEAPDLQGTEPGDHDRFSHYVRKVDQARTAVEGVPIIALCGKVWVPPYANGERFPVCPECKEIYERMQP